MVHGGWATATCLRVIGRKLVDDVDRAVGWSFRLLSSSVKGGDMDAKS